MKLLALALFFSTSSFAVFDDGSDLEDKCKNGDGKACFDYSKTLYKDNAKGDALNMAMYGCSFGYRPACKFQIALTQEKMTYEQQKTLELQRMQNLQYQQQMQMMQLQQQNQANQQLIQQGQNYINNLPGMQPQPAKMRINCRTKYNTYYKSSETVCDEQ